MAGPTITVSVLGDSKPAVKALNQLGDAADDAASDVAKAGTRVGDGLGKMTEAADGGERRFRGMNDTLGGTQSLMDGLASGDIVGVISGLTDLAGGIADFVGPALTKMAEKLGLVTVATQAETVAQEEANIAMSANPIGLIVLALVALAAAFYIAWTKSETFRAIVTGAIDAVTGAAQAAFGWVSDHWPLLLVILTGPFGLAFLAFTKWRDDIVGLFAAIPDKIGEFATKMFDKAKDLGKHAFDGVVSGVSGVGQAIGDGIVGGVKAVVNGVVDAINAVQIHLHFDPAGRFGPSVDFDWNGLGIPHLAGGAFVRGTTRGTLAVIGDGVDEAVVPMRPGQTFGSTTIYYPAGYNRRAVADAQRRWTRLNPGPS